LELITYFRQVNGVNGGDYDFMRCVSVYLYVREQRRDVIAVACIQ